MAHTQCFEFKMCSINVILSGSLILNLFIFCNMFIRQNKEESWTKKAVEEAELLDSMTCSGHGRAFLDGSSSFEEERPVCECNACFTGPDCSHLVPGCLVDADSGDPTFLEPFWKKNAADSSVLVSGWHRLSYEFSDGSLMSEQLQIHIKKLHAVVGNAVTEDKFIIFGGGATQLLHAAVHALSEDGCRPSPAAVVASAPYYPVYREQTELFKSENYKFVGDSTAWKGKAVSRSSIIELITSPNNPDGKLRKSVIEGSFAKRVHDLAYYWPHFTAIPSPADEDVMIFTLSKLTGHAGSRFGWAIVKDKAIYGRMTRYLSLTTYGVPKETQLRVLKLLKVVLKEDGKQLFGYGHERMTERWRKLSHLLSSSCRLSLQELQPQYCSYFDTIREPSPAFAWIMCERIEEENCNEVLKMVNVTGRDGSLFGVSSGYVRLSLVKSDDDFHLLLERMKMLVAAEESTRTRSLPWDVTVSRPYDQDQLRTTTSESNAYRLFFDSNHCYQFAWTPKSADIVKVPAV